MGKKLKVEAECHSDDHAVECAFDAARWLAKAITQEIIDLAECDWGGDYPADNVAIYLAGKDKEIKFMFDYIEHKKRTGADVGFECHVNGQQALAWLKKNRPNIHARVLEAIQEK